MNILKQTIYIDPLDANLLQHLLDMENINFESPEIQTTGITPFGTVASFSAKFENGTSVLLEIRTNKEQVFEELTLFHEGKEIPIGDSDYQLLGDFSFEYQSDTYLLEVKQGSLAAIAAANELYPSIIEAYDAFKTFERKDPERADDLWTLFGGPATDHFQEAVERLAEESGLSEKDVAIAMFQTYLDRFECLD